MTQLNFKNLKTLFQEIGLYSPKGQFYKGRIRKYQQILAYIQQIESACNKLSAKRPIVFLDCGCGKSYLSFVFYEYCRTRLNRKIKIIGIDSNSDLIKQCKKSAEDLGFENMRFYHGDIESFPIDEKIDIVYSLHVCDTGTDQTIAKGIKLRAKYIFSVSCCQHTNREKMIKHPLKSVSRHQPYKERIVDMVGDSMRALLLENFGYGVKVFEFTSTEQTPKNIMLRAVKDSANKEDQGNAMVRYKQLVKTFNFSPALEYLLRDD